MSIESLIWLEAIGIGAVNLGIGAKRVVSAIKKAKEQGYVLSIHGKHEIVKVIKTILLELFVDFVPGFNLMQLYYLLMRETMKNDRSIKYQLILLGILHLTNDNEEEPKEELHRPISTETKVPVMSEAARKAQQERIMRNGRTDFGMDNKKHTYTK